MNVQFYKNFKKTYDKLPKKIQEQADERLVIFKRDAFSPLLNNHALSGKYQGCRSINVTGDWRAIYKPLSNDLAYFVKIGTHGKLYK